MGKEARTALLLAATACLLAVMVEWIIGELQSDLAKQSDLAQQSD